jgi:uncharacterized OB-fold protein
MSDAYAGPRSSTTGAAIPGYRKPMPRLDPWNKPFWDATREHRLLAQRDELGNVWLPPGPVSPFTLTDRWEWVPLCGRGTVTSWVVFHQNYFSGFADELPYNVALVQLDEGPTLFTNLVGLPDDAITIGLRVEVAFSTVDDHIALPVFRPISKVQP